MCGIAGFLTTTAVTEDAGMANLASMGRCLYHRGPDQGNAWYDAGAGIGFCHRRLSIIDLTPAGLQPMTSASGRYIITFNGEIYNYLDLKQSLERSGLYQGSWRGHSDTELMLAAFEAWGVPEAISKCVGMFAFGLWDRQERQLILGRDRLGEKPLYCGWQGDTFLFGSELKAMKAHPAFSAVVDQEALSEYMHYGYVPAPYSIYKGISKLKQGCLLYVSASDRRSRLEPYWSAEETVFSARKHPFRGSDEEAISELEGLLSQSIRGQMLADVPLGAFLSGGVDSSTIVALMQAQSSRKVKTFSIGFEEPGYNEAEYAGQVAEHLGTEHTELYVSARDALNVVPELPRLYDEPFSDSSQIPTYLLARMTREYVTVALSGDAGDELFCGYNRYISADRFWSRLSRMPLGLRRFASKGIVRVSPGKLDYISGLLNRKSTHSLGTRLHKAAAVLDSRSVDELYLGLVSQHESPGIFLKNKTRNGNGFGLTGSKDVGLLSDIERMMLYDLLRYLPDDILVKVDRAAMGVSLETRVPFLDHRIVDFAWRLPLDMKIRNGTSKWIIRQILYKYVPASLIERPKMGFGIPLDQWLRGPLRPWAEELLGKKKIEAEGYLDHQAVSHLWQEHLSGSRNRANILWNILMFQAWLNAQ